MNTIRRWSWLAVLALAVVGCSKGPEDKPAVPDLKPKPEAKVDPEIEKALSELSPESRKLAEAQKKCAVSDEPLGSMGKPVELKLNGETVFLCCEHCRKSAEKDPEKTAAKAKKLREREKTSAGK
jgi:hypothetical protein